MTEHEPKPVRRRIFTSIPFAIAAGAMLVIGLGATMVVHAESKVNRVALDRDPKPVSVVLAKPASFRGSRSYVGTIEPWVSAKIGPQLVSAYVATVLVRPGAVVAPGQVVATLDCRNASASSRSVMMQAQALEARQRALADEAQRLNGLLDGGFVSPNEVEQKSAQSVAARAQLQATRAQALGTSLQVDDCVLRAPFAGEIANRSADPGAFAHPGMAIVEVVDRATVRVVADAPEVDFRFVPEGTAVELRLLATGARLAATISRRAPVADTGTRTVHFEIDVPDPQRSLPVGTTAAIEIAVGDPTPALEVPLPCAVVRGEQATLFTVDEGIAHRRSVRVLGERAGRLYLEPTLGQSLRVVAQGRALLREGDRVSAQPETTLP